MKDYKEKYEEALKRADAAINIAADKDLVKGVATTIFPELAESEDERIREWLIEECQKVIDIANPAYDTSKAKKAIAWVEKQKEQKPKEWNEKPCLTCDEYDKGYKQGYTEGCTAGYNKAMLEQPKQEWSEEDEKHVNNILDIIDYWKATMRFVSYQGGTIDADITWLKSLRNHAIWKPSNEQMESLRATIVNTKGYSYSIYMNLFGWCGFLDIPVEGYDSDYNTSVYTDDNKYPKKEE